MGSGKSTLGRRLSEISGRPFVDLDRMIETSAGRSVAAIFAEDGEEAFRRIEAALLPLALSPATVVALGGGAPMADQNWRVIQERALSVHLRVSFDAIWARLESEAESRPLIRGRTSGEVRELYLRRLERYGQADREVDADRPLETLAREVLALWSE